MQTSILITGSTDGIGLETAKMLATQGHHVLLHGRNPEKVKNIEATLNAISRGGRVESYVADLSRFDEVEALSSAVAENHAKFDILINNAGVFKATDPITKDGLDIRFVVNTLAPYLLTRRLLPLMGTSSRVINLSSAAQAPVNIKALAGATKLDDMSAYAQSKLAITMWSRAMATEFDQGPSVITVNPGSLLASKMVKEGFGVPGNDIRIGADILIRAALSDEFASVSGKYFDNDSGQFASPHADALDAQKCEETVRTIEKILKDLS